MDDDTQLSGAPPRGLWNTMAKGAVMEGFTRGARVYWGPTDTEAIGTVIDDELDGDGLIMVQWDGIGAYPENPIDLRPVGGEK